VICHASVFCPEELKVVTAVTTLALVWFRPKQGGDLRGGRCAEQQAREEGAHR